MDFLFDAIANAISFFYDLTSSYGLSIMLLTLVIMIVVTPLTLKSTRSMISMQQLQPELRKLQAKYKDDRQKLNEEMMAFYKEHNINPLGGCLPLIVQAPIFIVLYRVLLGLTKKAGYGEDMGTAVGLYARNPRGGGFFAGYGTFDPGYLDHTSQLYLDLTVSREMNFLGLDLAESFMNTLTSAGVVSALPYLALVLVIGATAWYQQRQIQARTSDKAPQINPQQQMLMKVMPFFLPIFSLTIPAGVVLYFLVSNVYRIGQQAFITHTMYSEKAKAERDKAAAARKKKAASAGDVEPVDEVSRTETVPTGSRSLFGGLIQLPSRADSGADGNGEAAAAPAAGKDGKPAARGSGGSSKSGSSAKAKTTGARAPARSAPSRAAPARPARPASQNRSKKKKQRK